MDALFILALGGAVLIMICGGIRIARKYPRGIRQPTEPRGFTEAEWIEIVQQNQTWAERERERIQRQEICSDKSHWSNTR